MQAEVGGISLVFETRPGLFFPAYPDRGTLTMLSVTELKPREKCLDLGCGYGLVGIYLAKIFGAEHVFMVDVDPNAVEAARKNAKLNGVGGIEVAVSDAFSGVVDEDFTLILSNPPYHADFSVAKAFIEGSFAHLAMGGRLVMVVKRVGWYRNKIRTVFGGVRVTEKGGYTVLEAEKRSSVARKKVPKPPPRKHLLKMARSARS